MWVWVWVWVSLLEVCWGGGGGRISAQFVEGRGNGILPWCRGCHMESYGAAHVWA